MFMVFFLFLCIHIVNCQLTTTTTTSTAAPTLVYGCSFANSTYLSNAAASNQFRFLNSTSVSLAASYAFVSSPLTITTFEVGLIYPFSSSTNLVPFPVVFTCASTVHSCQLKTVPGTTVTSRDAEPIRVPLTPFNYSSNSIRPNQMGFYLKQGRYQLSNCSINDGADMTDPYTVFTIQIDYEKPVGKARSRLQTDSHVSADALHRSKNSAFANAFDGIKEQTSQCTTRRR